MSYRNLLLSKTYVAAGAIAQYRVVMHGAADGQVLQGTAAAENQMGVIEGGAVASGERVTVNRIGIAEVECGGAVVRGVPVTADADGKIVAATAAQLAIGTPEMNGASGDIVPMLIGRERLAA